MHVDYKIGPSHEQLRPTKYQADKRKLVDEYEGATRSSDFPVYPQLVSNLQTVRVDPTRPHATARHVCAVLSAWSYSDLDTVSQIMGRLGLFEARCRVVELRNNGMLVRSTAYLVQSACRSVTLLAYRGTDPFDFSTWAASADANPVMVPVRDNREPRAAGRLPILGNPSRRDDAARVHGGWYRNQRSTWFALAQWLRRAANGESILCREELIARQTPAQLEREQELDDTWKRRRSAGEQPIIFLTGHSLGGAMANIAAYKIASDADYADLAQSVAQIYTFAQPMVGNDGFKQAWDAASLHDRLFCHAHQGDVAPHMPPADTRRFVHVGKHYASIARSDDDPSTPEWKWGPALEVPPVQARSWTDLVSASVEFLAGQLPTVDLLLSVSHSLRSTAEKGTDALQTVASKLPVFGRFVPGPLPPRGRYSFYDHIPSYYVAASQPDGVLTEFGDDF